MYDQKNNNNNQNNNKKMSFIDETNNVTKKVQVKKRNKELNIKQTRLRKPLQNEKLLKNYFEFEKKQLTTSDVTLYKMVNTSIENTYTSNNNNNDSIENITTNSSDVILDASTPSSSNSGNSQSMIETPTTIVGVDKIVTSQKVKYENLNQIINNQNSSTNQQHSIINSTITHNSNNRSEGTSSTSSSNSESTCSSSNENSKEVGAVEEEEEFNDCESFLSSISFLYH